MGLRIGLVAYLAASMLGAASAARGDEAPKIGLEPIVRQLERPVYLTHDGSSPNRLFIVEQPGRIRLVEDGKLQKRPYLDIRKRVVSTGECGLLSVAFHPQFEKNGLIYVNYTGRPAGKLVTIISEFKVGEDPLKAQFVPDPFDERVVLQIDQPYANHNGGQNKFGPDGMLYIGMGDGGSAGDPHDHGQRPDSLLGKILRIDVDSEKKPYGIPSDNPFINRHAWRPEIWALGLRNPWRFSFDRETGTCWTGDVGQNKFEEIDILVRGGNYGWRLREGAHPFKPDGQKRNLIDPVKEYGRELGVSVTGGYVYRGKAIPDLQGWYIYGDYGSGRIWGLQYDEAEHQVTGDIELIKINGQPASFGEDLQGEIYLCDHLGIVSKIVGK